MNFNLKRWFSRSIVDGPEMMGPQLHPSARATKRKMTLVVLAGALALVGTVSGGYYFAMRPVTLRIAVGPQTSDDAKVVQALTQTFARDHGHVRLRPVLTDGALASAAALTDGKVDLAVIRGDLDVPKNARAVATLRKDVAVLWVPARPKAGRKAGGKITKITQLAGKRVGIFGRTQVNQNLLKIIGLDPAKMEFVQFATNEVAEGVKDQKLDALIAVGPVNSKLTADAIAASSRDGKPTFLAIDSAEAIAQNHPVYESVEIPAGAFGGSPDRPDQAVKTVSFAHHIVARQSVSDSTISTFTRQLFAARQSMMAEFPQAAKIETPDTDKDAVIPAHAGAAAYVDGEERSFLDRYSDYIWFGLIGFSALGSIGAWFAGYLRKDERNTNTSLRERLLDMIAVARGSNSTDELDAMQTEADSILRDTLNCFESGAIEEGTLTAFNIALEQFHNAVADRKALLAALPPAPLRNQRPQAV
jgi:TRAP transporter TAXI family solute receptor